MLFELTIAEFRPACEWHRVAQSNRCIKRRFWVERKSTVDPDSAPVNKRLSYRYR